MKGSNRQIGDTTAKRCNVIVDADTEAVLLRISGDSKEGGGGKRSESIRKLARLYAQLEILLTPSGVDFIRELMGGKRV